MDALDTHKYALASMLVALVLLLSLLHVVRTRRERGQRVRELCDGVVELLITQVSPVSIFCLIVQRFVFSCA